MMLKSLESIDGSVHGDLKPDSFLVDKETSFILLGPDPMKVYKIVLSDFELIKKVKKHGTDDTFEPKWYCAPVSR